MSEPQTFIAYTWGVFASHRQGLYDRTEAVKNTVIPMIRIAVNEQFGFAAPIFSAGRFPGRYLALVPRE